MLLSHSVKSQFFSGSGRLVVQIPVTGVHVPLVLPGKDVVTARMLCQHAQFFLYFWFCRKSYKFGQP